MMSHERTHCRDCRFWHDYDGQNDEGECRVHPPVVSSLPADITGRPPTLWPETLGHHWCGKAEVEWKPASSPKG